MINHSSIKENVTFITYVANKCNNNRHCIFEKPEIQNDRLCALFAASYFTLAFYYHFSFLCPSWHRRHVPDFLRAWLPFWIHNIIFVHPSVVISNIWISLIQITNLDNDLFGNDTGATINQVKYKKPIFILR